jgi:hypothetical protein
MAGHGLDRSLQTRNRFDISNGAEQTYDRVELTSQIKVQHVALVKADFGMLLFRDR